MEKMGTLWLLFALCSSSFGARILMIPVPGKSHVRTMVAAGQALLEDGHDVTVMTGDNFDTMITSKGLISMSYPGDTFMKMMDTLSDLSVKHLAKGETFQAVRAASSHVFGITNQCDVILSNDTLMYQVEQQKFDLAIVEGTMIFSCLYIIPYKYDIPFMSFAAFFPPWDTKLPSLPSYEPIVFLPLTSEMSFIQRALNLIVYSGFTMIPYPDELLAKHTPEKEITSIRELGQKSEMWLSYMETWCLDYPRISAPHFQYIGGTSVHPAKPLPEHLERFAQDAQHGIILLSYGSTKNFRKLLHMKIDKFLEAFRHIPQKVMIALDCDGVDIPDNVLCMDWIPQNDVLGHTKTVLFITHGGTNGQMEAIRHGVPMISIGVISEQIYNSVRIEHHGYGKQLYLHNFKPEDLVHSIEEVINNKTYKTNIDKCSQITQSFPSAGDSFVFWVNHILKFGGAHLRPKSLDLPFYQLFMLDVLAVFIMVLFGILLTLFCGCRYVIRKCCRKNANSNQQKHKSE